MTVAECPDAIITTLDGNYLVVTVPAASYCTLSVTNAYSSRIGYTEAKQLFLKSGIDATAENKNYDNVVNIGTLQSSNCVKIQYSDSNSDNWYGFYPELQPGQRINLQLMNFEQNCAIEVALYSFGTEKQSIGY